MVDCEDSGQGQPRHREPGAGGAVAGVVVAAIELLVELDQIGGVGLDHHPHRLDPHEGDEDSNS